MGDFFGRLLGGLSEHTGGVPPVGQVLSDVMSSSGGVDGLVERMQAAGLTEQVRSWVGNGQNLPVSADDLAGVFSPEELDAWGAAHGIPGGAVLQMLSVMLPHAVDHATEGGDIPADSSQPLDFTGLAARLFGAAR